MKNTKKNVANVANDNALTLKMRENNAKSALTDLKKALSVQNLSDIHTANAVVFTADKFANLSLISKIKAISVIKLSNLWKNAYSQVRRKKFTNFYDYAQEIARIGKTTANKYVQAGDYIDDDGNILLPKSEGITADYSAEMVLTLVEMIRAKKGENAEKILEMLKNGVVTPLDTVEYAKKTIKGHLTGKIKDLTDDGEITDDGDEMTDDGDEMTDDGDNTTESDESDKIADNTAQAIIIAKRWANNADFMDMLYKYDREHTAD